MNFEKKLEQFGKEIVTDVIDENIDFFLLIKSSEINTEEAKDISNSFKSIELESFQNLISTVIKRTVFSALNAIEDNEYIAIIERDFAENNDIETLEEVSDGLSGELYGRNGWLSKYSKY